MKINTKQTIEIEKDGIKMNLTMQDICMIIEEAITYDNTMVYHTTRNHLEVELDHVCMNGPAIQFNLIDSTE